MMGPFALSGAEGLAPTRARQELRSRGGEGEADMGASGAAFEDALGRALDPAGSGGEPGKAGASPGSAGSDLDLLEANRRLPATARCVDGERDGRAWGTEADEIAKRCPPATDEAAKECLPARRSRPRKRAARAGAEAAMEALAAPVQHAAHPRGGPHPESRALGTTSVLRGTLARATGDAAALVRHKSKETLLESKAAARPSAAKAALDAASPLSLPLAAGRHHRAEPAAGRQAEAPAREKPREKDREGAKLEVAGSASRPDAALQTSDARAPAPRVSSGAAAAPPSASDRPRASLPPSPGADVQGALLRHAAHLKIDGGQMGALELHLRVREGALHLRVEGDAARAVEARAGELSRALAGEGLKLAPIESTARHSASSDPGTTPQGGGGGRAFEERREAWNEAAESGGRTPPASPPRSSQPWPASPSSSGVHVKA